MSYLSVQTLPQILHPRPPNHLTGGGYKGQYTETAELAPGMECISSTPQLPPLPRQLASHPTMSFRASPQNPLPATDAHMGGALCIASLGAHAQPDAPAQGYHSLSHPRGLNMLCSPGFLCLNAPRHNEHLSPDPPLSGASEAGVAQLNVVGSTGSGVQTWFSHLLACYLTLCFSLPCSCLFKTHPFA